MPYTAKQQLDLIKANKLEIINKINELLGKDSGLTWDSSWTQFLAKINEIKTILPIENDQIITEIEHFIANQSINSIAIASDKIKENMFRQKSSLLTIDAPNVEQIEQYAFHSATGLISIAALNCVNIGDRAFYGCNKLESAVFNESCALGPYAFYGCTKLSVISNNLTTNIPTNVFYNCYNLELNSDSFPTVKTIGSYAFYNCDKLTDFNFDGVTSIGGYAFQSCSGLTEIDLTGCSANIGSYAFRDCTNVDKVIIPDTITGIQSWVFYNLKSTCKIYCEQEAQPGSWYSDWNYSSYPVYWNAKLRDYHFITNNGETDIVKSLRVIEESDLPVLTREGYQFDSWYTDSTFSNKLKLPYISENNRQIYARWIRGYDVVLVNYDTLEQTDIGINYYASLSDIPDYFAANDKLYTAIGIYLNSTCTTLVSELDIIHVPTPVIYIKTAIAPIVQIIKNFEYTGNSESYTIVPGEHVFECWGAQGGRGRSTYYVGGHNAGLGGYSKGTLVVSENSINGYIYVGGCGEAVETAGTTVLGGFNGGGNATYGSSISNEGSPGTGGGASDIRLNTDSLYARVIVAGGGGGTGNGWQDCNGSGGSGGGLSGIKITYGGYSSGNPGTQITGGTGSSGRGGGTGSTGMFGIGGNGSTSSSNQNGGGAGGGWYGGGGGGAGSYSGATGGGGGSGYVYTSETAQNYPSGCLLNSNYYLANAETVAGDQEFLAPNGELETGHQGNGYVRITSTIGSGGSKVSCLVKLVGITKTETQEKLAEIELERNIYADTLPKNFANWIFDKWYSDENRTTPISFPFEIVLNGELTLYTNIEEKRINDFSFTNSVQELLLTPGIYKLECWGAQGGAAYNNSGQTLQGGLGGYSTGTLTVASSVNCFIYVGGAGMLADTSTHKAAGGFNGGGNILYNYYADNTVLSGSGGGASDIRLGADSVYARVIVAGGGGGNASYSSSQTSSGMYGGGLEGGAGKGFDNGNLTGIAGGGTQASGGVNTSSYSGVKGSSGGFGTGGNGGYSTSKNNGAGGGAGWYGGAGGSSGSSNWCKPGGGGSGYVYTSATAKDYPDECLLIPDYYLTDAETIAGDQSFLSPTGNLEIGHSGNGHIRITKIGSN